MAHLIYNNEKEEVFNINTPLKILTAAAEANTPDAYILIVPTGRMVYEWKRRYIRLFYDKYGKPTKPIKIYTIQSLAKHIFQKLFSNTEFRFLSDAYRIALFEESTKVPDLKFYNPDKNTISIHVIQRLARIIFGLKEDGITPEKLFKDIADSQNPDSFGGEVTDEKKLHDIAKIFQSYNEITKDKFIDNIDLLTKLISKLKSLETEQHYSPLNDIFSNSKLILFYGFSEFKYYESRFVSTFVKCSISTVINIDYNPANGPLFGNLKDAIILLQSSGFNSKPEFEHKITENNYTNSQYLRQYLFNEKVSLENNNLEQVIKIFAFENRKEEINAIAKYIKNEIVGGIEPSDIAIALRTSDKYINNIRETFFINNIPVDISDRFPLESSQVITAIFSFLDIISYGYTKKNLHKLLSSIYLNFSYKKKKKDKISTQIDADNLQSVANTLKIPPFTRYGSKEFWLKRITSYKIILEELVESSNIDDENLIYHYQVELKKMIKAEQDFTELIEFFDFNHNQVTPQEFKEIINTRIIKRLEITDNISKSYNKLMNRKINDRNLFYSLHNEIEKDVRALNEFSKILNEMVFVLEERHTGKKFKFIDLTEKLKIAIQGGKFQIREKRGVGITVSSIEQLRGMKYKLIILPGNIDGEFPMNFSTDAFLGKKLEESEERSLESERMQFYQFLTSNEELLDNGKLKVLLTYPKRENESEFIRSSFIHSIMNIISHSPANCSNFIDFAPEEKDAVLPTNNIPWYNSITNSQEVTEFILAKDISSDIIENDFSELKQIQHCKNLLDYKMITDNNVFHDIDNKLKINNLRKEAKSKFAERENKEYSVSELENYKKCPFQLFASRILRLDQKEDENTDLSPLEGGNIFHNVLYRFYKTLQEKSLDTENWLQVDIKNKNIPTPVPIKLKLKNRNIYLDILNNIAKEETERFDRISNPFLQRDIEDILGANNRKGKLEIWLDEELKRIKDGWSFQPAWFELEFGGESNNASIEVKTDAGKIKLRGKIDRVEFYAENNNNYFSIADYKNSNAGTIVKNELLTKGIGLQIPIYAFAVTQILDTYTSNNTIKPAVGIYYIATPKFISENENGEKTFDSHKFYMLPKDIELQTPNGKKLHTKNGASSKQIEEIDIILETAIEKAIEYKNSINQGLFPTEPIDDNICKYCSYISVCRNDEYITIDE